ncbi:hypothetical protein BJY01DRAFT_70450 [Aspergillus pseudoustus]|uniref:Uncharacterized protein n=1 Tax=Aspergillus pseudoustus TaxID=1810923 RepID=A0ABR4L073_9EURO
MTHYSHPSLDLASECDPDLHHGEDDRDLISRNVNFGNTLALLKAVVALRFLQTTTAILRIGRSNSDLNSSLRRAVDRREQRIAHIVNSMTKDEFEKTADRLTSRALGQSNLTPSEILETHTPTKSISQGDERFLRVSLSSSTARPKHGGLFGQGTSTAAVDGNMDSRKPGLENGKEPKLSSPTRVSDSIYSSLGRSLSVSNVQSVSSGPRQCRVVSAAQYKKIFSEKEPQFSFVSQPWSIDSLVAESSRIDRSALEISEHPNEHINEHLHIKSADSFPGEFPVSEGLDYSSLATAKHHSRIPSVRTSVRPFSDL